MPWLIALAVVISVVGYFAYRAQDRKTGAQRFNSEAAPLVAPTLPPQRHTPDPTTPPPRAPTAPITTQKDACQLLGAVLASRASRPLRGAAADLRREMKEHAEELRTNIDFLRDEVSNKKEYQAVIAENFQDHLDEQGDSLGPNDEGIARTRRHIGHLDREIAEMQAALSKHQAALKEFRTDRTAFVLAFASHLLDGKPSPNVARNPDASP